MGLGEKWRNWRDLSRRKNAVTEAITSRNPQAVKDACANLNPAEITDDQKTYWLRSAIDEQNLLSFKEILRWGDNPNADIQVDTGGRYSNIEHYTPLNYALTQARTHDIALLLAGDPRVKATDDDLTAAKDHGMTDVAAVLAGRVADVRRHEADLRLAEAAHLDQEASLNPPAATPAAVEPAPIPAAAATDNGETWALMSASSVAHVTASPVIGRKLTEIFNFDNRERVIITENLKTGAESIGQAEKFDALTPETVQRATGKLKELTAADANGAKHTFKL